jgi:hypothetical protein
VRVDYRARTAGARVTPETVLESGVLHGLRATAGDPVHYALEVGECVLPLDALLGEPLSFETDGRAVCAACERATDKRFGGGYCYRCFTTLARCDLCVVSPNRCHYEQGTCREPEWGLSHCMRNHVVYLANTGGAKVGITHRGNVPGRFIEQGAAEALIVISTRTRAQAGHVEKALGRFVREQGDWRALVTGMLERIDLDAELTRVRRLAASAVAELTGRFTDAIEWLDAPERHAFRYPVLRYDSPPRQLRIEPGRAVGGVLLGVRGSYLLFDRGVLNVRAHGSLHVTVHAAVPAPDAAESNQLGLFP